MKFDIDDFEVKDAENLDNTGIIPPIPNEEEIKLVEEVKEDTVFNGEIIYKEEPAVPALDPGVIEAMDDFSKLEFSEITYEEPVMTEGLESSDAFLTETANEDIPDDLGDLNYHDEDEPSASVSAAGMKTAAVTAKQTERTTAPNKASGNNGSGNRAKGNHAAGSKVAGNSAAGSKVAGNSAAGSQDAGKRAAGSQVAGNSAAGSKAAGNHVSGNKTAGNKNTGNNGSGNRKPAEQRMNKKEENGFKHFIANLTWMDIAMGVAGVALIAVLLVILNVFVFNKLQVRQVGSFASIGSHLEELEGIGNDGIKGVVTLAADNVEIWAKDDQDEEIPITVTFTSVERDLKIKFENRRDEKLISNVKFEIEALGPDKNDYLWLDEDMDGIIYQDKLTPGEYLVTIKSIDEYHFPETATKVTVKDKITYTAINIINEIKTEDEVDVAKEDTEDKGNVDEEPLLKDTVEWVASTKTVIGGADGYAPIDKSKIKDPQTLVAYVYDRFFRAETITLGVGATTTLTIKPTDIDGYDESANTYSYSWFSGNEGIASVSSTSGNSATVKAVASGETSVFCNVTRTSKSDSSDTSTRQYSFNIVVSGGENPSSEKPSSEEPGSSEEPSSERPTESYITNLVLKTQTSVRVGESEVLTPSITPSTCSQDVTWKSSDESIVKVEAGKITGMKVGEATITCTSVAKDKDGKVKTATCKVTVTSGDLKVTVKDANYTVLVGEEYTITPTVSDYSSDNSVLYTSSNEKVAKVSEKGVVTGVSVGTAVITVSTKEKNTEGKPATATVNITVKANPKKDTTTLLKDEEGHQVYIKNAEGKYVEAKWADYYTATAFYITSETIYKYTGWQTIGGKTYFFDKNGKYVTGEQVIQGVKYNFASDGSLSMNGGVLGIDVSKWNGTIDWNAVKNSGISYVIIRCGYRGSSTGVLVQDPKFASYAAGANAAGLKVGIYFFSQAVSEVEAVEEASMAIALAKNYKIAYPIFIDTEKTSNGRANSLSRETRTAVCKAFCETVKNAGYTPGVYACKSWWTDSLNASALSGYKVWLAQYASQPSYSGRYDMWQYTDKGKVNGISGDVDMNISYLGY